MIDSEASQGFQPERPLAESIAAATRAAHSKLNKLIISRLPLALPTHAADPSLYASGILHIAPIYITFEALWRNILDTPSDKTPEGSIKDGCDPDALKLDNGACLQRGTNEPTVHRALACERVHSMLEFLHLPGLMRTERLKADLRAMTGWPDHILEEQLKTVSGGGRLAEFLEHMKRSVENRPHVLLSYSYIFFMALFAGGRFIRASLESVGDDFWNQIPSPIMPTMQQCQPRIVLNDEQGLEEGHHRSHVLGTMPLRFFHFPTPSDGEDLKHEFKKRLSESEAMLTARERRDVIQESVCIFENMTLLMHQLDSVLGEPGQAGVDSSDYSQLLGLPRNMLASRMRDSVALAKARRSAKSSSKQSSNDDSACCPVEKSESTPDTNDATPRKARVFTPMPDVGDIKLCPAMSGKAVRFQKPANHPSSPPCDGSSEELEAGLILARKMRTARLTHWVLVAAVGVTLFGAFVTGRRAVFDV